MDLNRKGIIEYISPDFINKSIKLIKFLVIYTIMFLILAAGLKYAIPFVIALIIALMLKPIKKRILLLNKKLKVIKISNGFVSFLLTSTIVILVLTLLTVIGYQVFIQTAKLIEYLTNPTTVDTITSAIDKFITSILASLHNLDPNITSKINEALMSIVTLVSGMLTKLGRNVLNLAVSIPAAMITILITLIATFFFTKDIEAIQKGIKGIFSEKGHELYNHVKGKMNSVFGGYIKAYALIMLAIAFLSYIIYSLANISYALPIAVLTAVLDFLPIIGAGMVFGILMITTYFTGHTTAAIILLIGYIIVAIVRQLLEQNLVASFIGVHPLVMIVALFIALTPLGFAGMFYFIGAFLLYQTVI